MDRSRPFSLPIAIGVTGHRVITADAAPAIERAVRNIFDELRAKAPNTPFLLLTGLAEGADRLVARIAAESYAADLVVVLPMGVEKYREDFETPESKSEFDRMLSSARLVVGPPPRQWQADDSASQREAGYADAGEWIALHSHLLIALWDGEEAHGKGGTAEVVTAKLRGHSSNAVGGPLHYDEGGAVAHVMTAREGAPPLGLPGTVTWIYPDIARIGVRSGEHRFAVVTSAFDYLNRLLLRDARTTAEWTGHQGPAVPLHVAALKSATELFAGRFQRYSHSSTRITILASVVAAISSALHGVLSPMASMATTVLALVIGCAVWGYAARSQWQRRHTDLRALAEACRIQLAWAASGLPYSVADHYHPVQAASVQWIRRAIRTAYLLDSVQPVADPLPAAQRKRQAEVGLAWINEQVAYFLGDSGIIARYRRRARAFAILGLVCFAIGLVVLASGKLLVLLEGSGVSGVVDPLLSVGKVTLAAAASLQAYQAFMGFADLQRSFAVSAHLFSVARREAQAADEASDYGRLQTVVFEVGRAALVENISWVLTRRQRRIRPSVGS